MIPDHNLSGVLPPFFGVSPTDRSEVSPYLATISEFAQRFSYSAERLTLLAGFLEYRAELRKNGIVNGMQWVDGSFLEKTEESDSRPPGDIDIVTVAHRPDFATGTEEWKKYLMDRSELFRTQFTKPRYHCDAYFVDLDIQPELLIRNASYWYGLFSHRRITFLWKGIVEIPLVSDDEEAVKALQEAMNA